MFGSILLLLLTQREREVRLAGWAGLLSGLSLAVMTFILPNRLQASPTYSPLPTVVATHLLGTGLLMLVAIAWRELRRRSDTALGPMVWFVGPGGLLLWTLLWGQAWWRNQLAPFMDDAPGLMALGMLGFLVPGLCFELLRERFPGP